MKSYKRPIILIHGLWNTSEIFNLIINKLDEYKVEYYAPTLEHDFGCISIIDLAKSLNHLILDKYGVEREIDIVGFSMGGIIGRYWLKNFNGYSRTKRFISIGSPHNGTLTAQLVPQFPLKGISEMKINSNLLKRLDKKNFLLEGIDCISFFTRWDLMVFPGWKAHLPVGKKFNIKIFKHRNLVRDLNAVEKILNEVFI